MKVSRFNEALSTAYSSLEEELESHIRDIIGNEVETRQVIYSDDIEVSSDSKRGVVILKNPGSGLGVL